MPDSFTNFVVKRGSDGINFSEVDLPNNGVVDKSLRSWDDTSATADPANSPTGSWSYQLNEVTSDNVTVPYNTVQIGKIAVPLPPQTGNITWSNITLCPAGVHSGLHVLPIKSSQQYSYVKFFTWSRSDAADLVTHNPDLSGLIGAPGAIKGAQGAFSGNTLYFAFNTDVTSIEPIIAEWDYPNFSGPPVRISTSFGFTGVSMVRGTSVSLSNGVVFLAVGGTNSAYPNGYVLYYKPLGASSWSVLLVDSGGFNGASTYSAAEGSDGLLYVTTDGDVRGKLILDRFIFDNSGIHVVDQHSHCFQSDGQNPGGPMPPFGPDPPNPLGTPSSLSLNNLDQYPEPQYPIVLSDPYRSRIVMVFGNYQFGTRVSQMMGVALYPSDLHKETIATGSVVCDGFCFVYPNRTPGCLAFYSAWITSRGLVIWSLDMNTRQSIWELYLPGSVAPNILGSEGTDIVPQTTSSDGWWVQQIDAFNFALRRIRGG